MTAAAHRNNNNDDHHDRDEQDVETFKQFLRIDTTHPNPKLGDCVAWLRRLADELGLVMKVHEFHAGLPVVVASKIGADPTLPSVVLNCHMDVVPFVADKWTQLPAGATPFSAYEDSEGRIFARGAQDMKCVGAQYLCALRRLGGRQASFLRTVHTLWVPDEEIGGPLGMQAFISSGAYKDLNIGVALDEGLAHDEDKWVVYYGERTPMWVVLRAEGPVGHASKLLDGTAADRLSAVVRFMSDWRDRGVAKLSKEGRDLGDVTSVNWTFGHLGTTNDGGKTYAYNVIPSDAAVGYDIRMAPDDVDAFMSQLHELTNKLGIIVEYPVGKPIGRADLSSRTDPFFRALCTTLEKWTRVQPAVFPAATDSRFLRRVGVQAYGFSPMRQLPSTLHDHNEYLPRRTYLEGVAVYTALIPALANLTVARDASSKL